VNLQNEEITAELEGNFDQILQKATHSSNKVKHTMMLAKKHLNELTLVQDSNSIVSKKF